MGILCVHKENGLSFDDKVALLTCRERTAVRVSIAKNELPTAFTRNPPPPLSLSLFHTTKRALVGFVASDDELGLPQGIGDPLHLLVAHLSSSLSSPLLLFVMMMTSSC